LSLTSYIRGVAEWGRKVAIAEGRPRDPILEEVEKHPAWMRLNDQLDWYDKKSGDNQRRYKQIKVAQLILAGSIPVFALVGDV
jgi:hypothetical protein